MDDETRPVKVHRVTLLIVDHDGLGADGVREVIEQTRYPNRCIGPGVIGIETREVQWHDGHPLNLHATWRAEVDALFGKVTL